MLFRNSRDLTTSVPVPMGSARAASGAFRAAEPRVGEMAPGLADPPERTFRASASFISVAEADGNRTHPSALADAPVLKTGAYSEGARSL